MSGDDKQGSEMSDFFDSWMKSATEFWQHMAKWQPEGFKLQPESSRNTGFHQYQQSWDSGTKMFQAMASILSDPDNINALFGAKSNLPEFSLTVAKQIWEGYCDVQKQWANQAAKLGKRAKTYNFEELDKETFQAFKEIYEKEFRKFFYVPQIGINRFYQERFNRAVDKYHLFQASLGEFIYMFYVPLERSLREIRQHVEKQVEQGHIEDNLKQYYQVWIKNLEGHYMKMLQSPEYLGALNNVIGALHEYRNSREEFLYDILKQLPIPTNRDMDEIYKEMYLMKKQLKALSAKLETQV